MSAYTCISCRVAFLDADLQRAHYKTDWHRYNLKRKVAEMPPVTAENFQQRVLAQRKQVAELEQETASNCGICSKHFSSKNAYENHLKSKKHKETEAKLEKQKSKQSEQGKDKATAELSATDRIAEKNARNMAIQQALVGPSGSGQSSSGQSSRSGETSGATSGPARKPMPDEEEMDDSDAESVESWEGEALGLEECLFCSHLSDSLEDNVKHMTVMHSFFIPDVEYLVDLEGLITYLGSKVGEGNICLWCNEKGRSFYSTKAVQRHMLDKGHCKMLHEGEALVEYSDFYDYRSSYPDYQEGQTEGATGEDHDDDEEDEVEENVLAEENYQLVLPSGASIGHRSLLRYYRQNLVGNRTHNPSSVSRVLAHYKAIGWTGTSGAAAQKKAKDIAYFQRNKARHHLRLNCKAHKLVKHFRDDNFGIK